MKKSKLTTKQIVLTGMMTAVLAVLSIVTIPLPTGVAATCLAGNWEVHRPLFI